MEVVLEMAHRCDDVNSSNNNQNNGTVSQTPSKDRLIEKIIFHSNDILTISALNVDMDHAVRGKRDSSRKLFSNPTVFIQLV